MTHKSDVWFVYDGDCPLCMNAALTFQIKKNLGALHLVNARDDTGNALLKEIDEQKLSLDEGMVLKYQDHLYHGQDALHMMAILGSNRGWLNCINKVMFRSHTMTRFCYPIMKSCRNLLLRIIGVDQINNLKSSIEEPIFKSVFGEQWNNLPPVMKKHYALRPNCNDSITVEGHLDVKIAPITKFLSRITGMLLAYSGDNVPITVIFKSDENGAFHFHRTFHFEEHGDVCFNSHMEHDKGNLMIEYMKFGLGWRAAYSWDGTKITLAHRGYVWRIFDVKIPMPISLIFGKGHAEESPIDDETFNMWTHVKHPIFGNMFGYKGTFKIEDVSCGQS